MRRSHVQNLGIAATAGVTAALCMGLAPSFSHVGAPPWTTLMLGAVATGLLVGAAHPLWTRSDRRHWQDLHDRQNQLDTHHEALACQVRLLELERQRLETIFNTLGDAVLVTADDDTVQLANDAAGRLLRLSERDRLPCPLANVVNDPRLLELIRETSVAANGSACRHLEYRHNHAGESLVFDLTLTPLESPAGVVAILRDVTQQRCVAQMHSDFVSGVSHELRTPLSSIKAYIEMLVDGEAQDEPTRQEFYAIIQTETNRLTRLIDNVLNISQIESGLATVQGDPVDLRSLAAQAIELMRPQAQTAGVNLQAIEPGEPCQVVADLDMLLQALLNLLGNAIKYTPEGGSVSMAIRHAAEAGMAEVSVRDTGLGIPEQDLPFIFDKFYRVASHRQRIKGTGLGLNLVKHVVETVHGGRLFVASRPGAGSTFTFQLSLADNHQKGGVSSPASDDPRSPSTTSQIVTPCLSGSTARKDGK